MFEILTSKYNCDIITLYKIEVRYEKSCLHLLICLFSVFSVASASSNSFSITPSMRGSKPYEEDGFKMTGSKCVLSPNKVKVIIDANTSKRQLKYKVQYWTPGIWGFTGLADECCLFNDVIENGRKTSNTIYKFFSSWTLIDTTYGGDDKANIRFFVSGATQEFYFEINDATFTFRD